MPHQTRGFFAPAAHTVGCRLLHLDLDRYRAPAACACARTLGTSTCNAAPELLATADVLLCTIWQARICCCQSKGRVSNAFMAATRSAAPMVQVLVLVN